MPLTSEDEADLRSAEAILANPGHVVELETFLAAEGF